MLGVFLALALLVSGGQKMAVNLPTEIQQSSQMQLGITAGVVIYHFLAGLFSLRVSRTWALFLLLFDFGLGLMLTYYYSAPYFFLSFALPVLEVTYFFGPTLGLFALVLGAVFFLLVLGFPLIDLARATSDVKIDPLPYALQLAAVQVALSVLIYWLCRIAVSESERIGVLESEARQEKDLLYQQIQSKSQEVGKIYAEVGGRQAIVEELQSRVQQAEGHCRELSEELEQAYQDLNNARLANQRVESLLDETQDRLESGMKNETARLRAEALTVHRKLDRMTRLMEVFRDLASNLTLNDTLLALTGQLQSLFPCQSCVIFLVDEIDGHKELFPEVAASPYTDIFRTRVLQIGEEAPGWAAQTGQPCRIDNTSVTIGGVEITTMVPYEKSALVSPLASGKEVLGAVYLGRIDPGEFSPEDLDLLTEICNLASLALSNSLDYQRKINRGLHDSVTRLYNGLYLEERLREEVMRGRRYTYPVSLILLDIDHFSEIYERVGEDGADSILKEVADVVRAATRETDVPARIEGDDFGVLCVHSDRDNAFRIGERIRSALDRKGFGPGTHKLKITASIGVAGTPHDATNEEQLHKRATDALQMARSKGGNSTCFWDG